MTGQDWRQEQLRLARSLSAKCRFADALHQVYDAARTADQSQRQARTAEHVLVTWRFC